jgi:hypothetical protein
MERYQDGQLITSSYFSEISPKMIQFETIDCSGANIIIDPMAFKKSIKNPLPCYIQTSVFRKSFFDTIQFDENLIGVEDALIQWVALNKKKCMAYINKVHLQYYVHESNISNANNSGSDLEKSIDRNNELEKLYKTAMQLDLTNSEANAFKHNLAELYFWRFGQMCYANSDKKNIALQYFLKGIKRSPLNIYFWKSLIAFMLKNSLKKSLFKISI